MMSTVLDGTSVRHFESKNTGVINPPPILESIRATTYELLKWSADLTSELSISELHDLIESEREFERGNSKFFKDSKSAIAWLESEENENR